MIKNVNLYLNDIFECIEKIEEYLKDFTLNDFEEDTKIQDAVLRRLEIIGEAVKKLPKDYKDKYPEIPWRDIAGTRDVLIHEYFGINFELIWKTIKEDLPALKEKVLQMKSS